MAPRKRKKNDGVGQSQAHGMETRNKFKRVTRSMSSSKSSSSSIKLLDGSQSNRKQGKGKGKARISDQENEEPVQLEEAEAAAADDRAMVVPGGKTIVIEHWTIKLFKTKADQVKEGLENGVPGTRLLLNPEQPRKGCFEVREEGGEKFITLLNMKRPFRRLKNHDMEKLISDIIDKIRPRDDVGQDDAGPSN